MLRAIYRDAEAVEGIPRWLSCVGGITVSGTRHIPTTKEILSGGEGGSCYNEGTPQWSIPHFNPEGGVPEAKASCSQDLPVRTCTVAAPIRNQRDAKAHWLAMRPVRISASRVSAVCGYNPFADVQELFLDAIYQDETVLALDRLLLGIQLVSEEEILADLLQKAGASSHVEGLLKQRTDTASVVKVLLPPMGGGCAEYQRALLQLNQ